MLLVVCECHGFFEGSHIPKFDSFVVGASCKDFIGGMHSERLYGLGMHSGMELDGGDLILQ